ncbi:MAG TPA: GNAT family N-acetyltransferase [Mycobacteriales bacterium]|nr:GNAT family N-acetyltransferase [Mycobacteriales bacterium]
MSANAEPAATLGERQATTPGGLVVRVVDVPEAYRFEAYVDTSYVGFTRYAKTHGEVVVLSTVTEPAWQGRGIATAMTDAIVAMIRDARWKIGPRCPFTADYLARRPELADLVAERYRGLVKPAYRPGVEDRKSDD